MPNSSSLPTTDALRDPLKIVQQCFYQTLSQQNASQTSLQQLSKSDWGVKDAFGDVFSAEAYESIPLLTAQAFARGDLRNQSLVRFRGMVQDVFDPEYFLGVVKANDPSPSSPSSYSDGKNAFVTSVYADGMPPGADPKACNGAGNGKDSVIMERLPAFCVPVPFETEWAKKVRQGRSPALATPAAADTNTMSAESSSPNTHKRALEQNDVSMDDDSTTDGPESESIDGKRVKDQAAGVDSKAEKVSVTHEYMPDPTEQGLCCIAKFYGTDMTDATRVNAIVECVGVLSIIQETHEEDMEEDASIGLDMARLPSSILVPRIHVIASKSFIQPETVQQEQQIYHNSAVATIPCTQLQVTAPRDALVDALAASMGGDKLAAEYCLMWTVSCIRARPYPSCLLGKLTLGLSLANSTACSTNNTNSATTAAAAASDHDRRSTSLAALVFDFMQSLLPRAQCLDLTINSLCQRAFSPSKDNQANRLRAGRLQMAAGTALVINESSLESGKLDDTGVHNLDALRELATNQQVKYNFEYFVKEWDIDYPTLVVSSAPKSLIPTDVHVVVTAQKQQPDRTFTELPTGVLAPEVLMFCRALISEARSPKSQFEVSEDMAKAIQQDFVSTRQANKDTTQEDFHLWMTLARMLCQTHGERTLSLARWTQVREMERQRVARLPPVPEPSVPNTAVNPALVNNIQP